MRFRLARCTRFASRFPVTSLPLLVLTTRSGASTAIHAIQCCNGCMYAQRHVQVLYRYAAESRTGLALDVCPGGPLGVLACGDRRPACADHELDHRSGTAISTTCTSPRIQTGRDSPCVPDTFMQPLDALLACFKHGLRRQSCTLTDAGSVERATLSGRYVLSQVCRLACFSGLAVPAHV